MVRVSKHILQPSHLRKLHSQLSKIIACLNKDNTYTFLDELLGEEEKVMITKRFAAIIMLMEHNSTYRISQLLEMSDPTIRTLKTKFNNGEYQHIEKIITKNKREHKDFWETLEIMLRAGLPPKGKGRWKSTFKIINKKHHTG